MPPHHCPKKEFCAKTEPLLYFKSAYHPHSIDQLLRYLRNDYLQWGGLSFPMPTADLCPSLNKYIYIQTQEFHVVHLIPSKQCPKQRGSSELSESHPISHCKTELDQKAGILTWEERQFERNSKPAQCAQHPQSDPTRGLKGSTVKFKQKSYE